MNKKDIAEIKKTLKPENSSINMVRTCYVTGKKNIVGTNKRKFLALEENEQDKYMDILKKALTGKLNHTLLDLEFPSSAKQENGPQRKLYNMMKDGLQDDEKAEFFFEEVVNTYEHEGNYLILLAHGNYGIPSKASDGVVLEDTDGIYSFIICCICPVELSKPGLCYNADVKTFVNVERDWVAGNPKIAFTFPTFSNRQMNVNHALYCVKKPSEPHNEIAETILGCTLPMAVNDQKEAFRELIQETLGKDANVRNIVRLNREINSFVEELKHEEEAPVMNRKDVEVFLNRTGIDKDVDAQDFEVMADVVADEKYVFEGDGVKLQVSKEYVDFVQQTIVNGKPCLLLPLNGITLNGIKLMQNPKNK